MSRDLALGTTRRDWSCGLFGTKKVLEDVMRQEEVDASARAADAEIRKTYAAVVRMTNAKILPAADRQAFAPILKKWQELSSSREGRWLPEDYLGLRNIREVNQRYAAKLATIAMADPLPPSRTAPEPSRTAPGAPYVPAMTAGQIILQLGLGIVGLIGISHYFNRSPKRHP